MKIIEVNKRLTNLGESNNIYKKSPINISNAYDKALETKSTKLIETVVENWRELDERSNIAFSKVLKLYSTYLENAKDFESKKMTKYIIEEVVSKVENIEKTLDYLDNKIENTDNVFVKEQYSNIRNRCKELRVCDRVLENYRKLSKRFNLDKYIHEMIDNNMESYDIVIEMCKFIDTYNIPTYAKYNTVLENSLYILDKNRVEYDRKEIVNAATDYFLMNESNDKLSTLRNMKSILESNEFYSDLIENKDDHKISKKNADIQFDYFFNPEEDNYSTPLMTPQEEAEWDLMEESSKNAEAFLSDRDEYNKEYKVGDKNIDNLFDDYFDSDDNNYSTPLMSSDEQEDCEILGEATFNFAEVENTSVDEGDYDPEFVYDSFFDMDDETYSSKLFDDEYAETEMELLSETNDFVFDTFFDKDDNNYSSDLLDEINDDIETEIMSEGYVNVVTDPRLAKNKSKVILPPSDIDDEMYEYHLKKMKDRRKLVPIQDEDNTILQGALSLKKMFMQKGLECNILKYTFEDNSKYLYLLSIIKPRKDDKVDYTYAIVCKDEKRINRVYIYYIYNSRSVHIIGAVDHFTFKMKPIKEETATIETLNRPKQNVALMQINQFKLLDETSDKNLLYLVEKFSSLNMATIIEALPCFLKFIKVFYLNNDNEDINKVMNVLYRFTDNLLDHDIDPDHLKILIEMFNNEKLTFGKCIDANQAARYTEYEKYLESTLEKLNNMCPCDEDRSDIDEVKELALLSMIETDIHYLKDTNLDVILDDIAGNLDKMDYENIDDITEFSIQNPLLISPDKLKKIYSERVESLRKTKNYMLIDCLHENIYKIDNIDLLNEGKLNRIFMVTKIHPRLEQHEILKKHEYPGLYNVIDKLKDPEDLKYLKRDCYSGIRQFEKLKENLEKYKKGDIKGNSVLNKLVKEGITSKDIDLTIKWYKEKYIPHISKRLKDLENLKNEATIFDEEVIYDLNRGVSGLKAIEELLEACKNYNPMVMNELSFTNSLKLMSEKIKKTFTKLSDKEKAISQSIDASANSLRKGIEKSLTNDNREAVIKGSIIPPASKIIKSAITNTGLYLIHPALTVINILGRLAISKKYKAKERQLVLDDIEIELKMTEKYLKVAEDNNDLEATKQLLKIQRNLERQRQRIRYKMKVDFNQDIPDAKTGDYED